MTATLGMASAHSDAGLAADVANAVGADDADAAAVSAQPPLRVEGHRAGAPPRPRATRRSSPSLSRDGAVKVSVSSAAAAHRRRRRPHTRQRPSSPMTPTQAPSATAAGADRTHRHRTTPMQLPSGHSRRLRIELRGALISSGSLLASSMMRSIWSPTAPRSLPRFFSGVCGRNTRFRIAVTGASLRTTRGTSIANAPRAGRLDVGAVERRRLDRRALDLAAHDVDRQPHAAGQIAQRRRRARAREVTRARAGHVRQRQHVAHHDAIHRSLDHRLGRRRRADHGSTSASSDGDTNRRGRRSRPRSPACRRRRRRPRHRISHGRSHSAGTRTRGAHLTRRPFADASTCDGCAAACSARRSRPMTPRLGRQRSAAAARGRRPWTRTPATSPPRPRSASAPVTASSSSAARSSRATPPCAAAKALQRLPRRAAGRHRRRPGAR